jgi:drug/metabolite transporter (DMT)-like permease
MQASTLKIHGALFTVALIYAASYTVTKELTPLYIAPRAFILLRVSGALLMMLVYGLVWKGEKIRNTRDLLYLAACAFFGVGLNMILFFEGLARTSPINASLIMVCSPILILLIGFITRLEKLTSAKVAGILLGTLGAALLISGKADGGVHSSVAGDLLILGNAASYSIYLLMIRPMMAKYNAMTVIRWLFVFSVIMVTPLGISGLSAVQWAALTPALWAGIVFIIVGTTFLAYTLNAYALRFVSSSVVGSYVYLQPVLAIAIALGSRRYSLHWQQLIYAFLIFAGVYMVSYKGRRKAEPVFTD